MIQATRYHDISCGHRVVGHENKCRHLHGHNYRITFHVESNALDEVGRTLDFGIIKSLLCEWLEDVWDHKFLVFDQDPWKAALQSLDPDGICVVPFNPTAENMAQHLLHIVGPMQLRGTGARLEYVQVEETRKCAAIVWRD